MSFVTANGGAVSCSSCGRPRRVHRSVNLAGQLVERTDPCLACPYGRRKAGICRDCNHCVEGTIGKAVRCAAHKLTARRRQQQEHLDRNGNRERKNETTRTRYHARDPFTRARRRKQRRTWAAKNPDKVRGQRTRYAVRHPEVILAGYERHSNANRPDRAEAKRQWAREHQVVYAHGAPTCADCHAKIPWKGTGRPHKRCPACDPRSWQGQAPAVRLGA